MKTEISVIQEIDGELFIEISQEMLDACEICVNDTLEYKIENNAIILTKINNL